MDSDVTQSATFYKLWDWGEMHKKQLLIGLIVVVVVGLGIAYYFVHQGQQQENANDALSKLMVRTSPNAPETSPEAFLKVAAEYPDTDAGQRALLLGASALFTQGNYDEARAQFQRFLQAHSDSPFAAEAALGVATCLEAQGKTDDAITSYRNVAEHYQTPNVVPQAKLALARLDESQGKLQDARSQLEDVVRTYAPPIGTEARNRLEQLLTAHPELMATNAPATANRTGLPAFSGITNRPAVAPVTSNRPPMTFSLTNKPPASSSVSNQP